MTAVRDDDRSERWEAKKAHYQREDVVEKYDDVRFRNRHERRSTDKKWRLIRTAVGSLLPPRAKVLDVPAGTGRFTRHILDAGYALTSADLSFPMLQAAQRVAGAAGRFDAAVRCDVERLPFADGAFDLVMSIRFLFHVPPELRAGILRELGRVSRGYVVVDVRHKYCYATHTKRFKAWIRRARAPSARASLAQIDRDVAASGLQLVQRIWLAPLLSEKMLLVLRTRAQG